jgi:hypothetical protein
MLAPMEPTLGLSLGLGSGQQGARALEAMGPLNQNRKATYCGNL